MLDDLLVCVAERVSDDANVSVNSANVASALLQLHSMWRALVQSSCWYSWRRPVSVHTSCAC